MKKKILLIPFAVLLLSAMMAPALAQAGLIGVQVGDWFKYEAKVPFYESEGPFPPPLSPLNLFEN